jgi:hypothetical protein
MIPLYKNTIFSENYQKGTSKNSTVILRQAQGEANFAVFYGKTDIMVSLSNHRGNF